MRLAGCQPGILRPRPDRDGAHTAASFAALMACPTCRGEEHWQDMRIGGTFEGTAFDKPVRLTRRS